MWEISPRFTWKKTAVVVGSSFAFRGEENPRGCGSLLRVSRGKSAVVVGAVFAIRGGESRGSSGSRLRVSRRRKPRWFFGRFLLRVIRFSRRRGAR